MSLYSALSMTLLLMFHVSEAAAIPTHNIIQTPVHDQYAEGPVKPSSFAYFSTEAALWVSSAQFQPPNQITQLDESPDAYRRTQKIVHGKDDREKMVALCEVGFIYACRLSVVGAESSDSLHVELGSTQRSAPKLRSSGARDDYETEPIAPTMFPPFRFFVVSIAVFCVLAVFLGLWKINSAFKTGATSLTDAATADPASGRLAGGRAQS